MNQEQFARVGPETWPRQAEAPLLALSLGREPSGAGGAAQTVGDTVRVCTGDGVITEVLR